MSLRTDLALECRELVKDKVPKTVLFSEKLYGDTKVTRIEIKDKEGETSLNKPKGTYVTIELRSFNFDLNTSGEDIEVIANEIKGVLGEKNNVLIAGLGNRDITPDAIGPMVCDMSLATRHITKINPEFNFNSTAVISPGVMGQTGVETGEIVKSICREIGADAVIVIDALASKSVSRLGKTVQISDSGITPGSGVGNSRAELSKKTIGVPVIAIGVPTVIDAETILEDLGGVTAKNTQNLMVTPREIDSLIKGVSKILSLSIGRALQPQLSCDELYFLTV